jgi:hypothetical protein
LWKGVLLSFHKHHAKRHNEENTMEMLSTWGTAGNGYVNQEGHHYICVARNDGNPEFPFMFESVSTPGYQVAGKRTGYGRIVTEAK